jgi:hypothetical protein
MKLSAWQVGEWQVVEAERDIGDAHVDDSGLREWAYDPGVDSGRIGFVDVQDLREGRWCEGLAHGSGLGRFCVLNCGAERRTS